jgi:minor fimbrial subunit
MQEAVPIRDAAIFSNKGIIMNMKFKHSLLALSVLLVGINQAVAAPTQVNITGTVIASPCSVDTSNSDLDVNLGNIQAADLSTAGAGSTLVPFKLKLKDCPASTTSAVVTFSGTEDTAAPGRYINTGTALNVAVEVQETSTGDLKGPTTNITQTVQADRSVTYDLQTRAYAKAAATPGSVIATVQATFTYQ